MFKLIKTTPECIYGNQCHTICVNPSCRKPGFMCPQGATGKECCGLFHGACEKMAWSEFENVITDNKNAQLPEFYSFQDEMENFFSSLIRRVKD